MTNFFNIIIRTSNRPNYFKNCIKSVMNQTYKNFYVYIIYDTEDDMNNYLESYNDLYSEYLTFFEVDRIERKNDKHFPYNDYLNSFFNNEDIDLKEGFILFLDDDCKFKSDEVLYNLDKNIEILGATDNPADNFYMFKCQIGNTYMPSKSIDDGTVSDGDIYICGTVIHTEQILNDDITFEENINAIDNVISTLYSQYNGIYIDECYVYTDSKGNGMRNDLVISKIKFKIPEKDVRRIEKIEQIENENKISEKVINEIQNKKVEEIENNKIEEIENNKVEEIVENKIERVENKVVENNKVEEIVEIVEEKVEITEKVIEENNKVVEENNKLEVILDTKDNDIISDIKKNIVVLNNIVNNAYIIDKNTLSTLFITMSQILTECNTKQSIIEELQNKIKTISNNNNTNNNNTNNTNNNTNTNNTNISQKENMKDNIKDFSNVSSISNSSTNNYIDIYLLVKNNLTETQQSAFTRNSKILEKHGISWIEYPIKDTNYYKHIKDIINNNKETKNGIVILNGTELFNYNIKLIIQKIIDTNPDGFVLFGNSIDGKDISSQQFEWDLYLKMYPDISNAKIKAEKGKQHWSTFGIKEYRPANVSLSKKCNLLKDTFCGLFINSNNYKTYLELYDKNRNFTLFDIKNMSKEFKESKNIDCYSIIPEICIPLFATDNLNIRKTICSKNNWYYNFYC